MRRSSQEKKFEKVLFSFGVALGALIGARGLIEQKSMGVVSTLKSRWSQHRLPAGGSVAADECSEIVDSRGNLQWQRMRFRSGNCSLMIRSSESRIPSRILSFGSNGAMMIFSQFGRNVSRESGAQLYFLFPRSQSVPAVNVLSDTNEVAVRTAAGAVIRFSLDSGEISRTSPDLAIDQSSAITESNRGGIAITSWSGILLNVGFSMREQPYYRRPNGVATFSDSSGAVCRVRNSDIYDYSSPEEPLFRLQSDKVALAFLERHCANLDLSSLRPQAAAESERATSLEAAPSELNVQQRAD